MKIDVFHIGPQKTATTWAYHCMKEHPEISVPNKDAIHFFDINYHKGEEWLKSKFPKNHSSIFVETTPSYIRSTMALERIKEHNSDAKIVVCVRRPLERMVSHYWHEKKKGAINYKIEDVMYNYDLFNAWIEASMYGHVVEYLYKTFGENQVLVQVYDDLKNDSKEFLKELYAFVGVSDVDYSPESLERRINKATKEKSPLRMMAISSFRKIRVLDPVISVNNKIAPSRKKQSYDTGQFLNSLSGDFLKQIEDVTRKDVKKLSEHIGRDMLKEWGYTD